LNQKNLEIGTGTYSLKMRELKKPLKKLLNNRVQPVGTEQSMEKSLGKLLQIETTYGNGDGEK